MVTDPARPTSCGTAARHRGEGPVDRGGDVGLGRRDLGRGRRVVVQVPFGEADAADVDADRGAPTPPRAEHELGRAAADVDHQVRRRESAPAGRHRAGEDRRASSSPLTTSGAKPRVAVTIARKSSALAASRVALVATIRVRPAPARGDLRGVVDQRHPGALDRLRGQPAGAVDALAEPHDLHLAEQVDERAPSAATSAISRRTELVPQSIAAHAWSRSDASYRCSSIRVLPRVLGLTRSRSRNSATPSS